MLKLISFLMKQKVTVLLMIKRERKRPAERPTPGLRLRQRQAGNCLPRTANWLTKSSVSAWQRVLWSFRIINKTVVHLPRIDNCVKEHSEDDGNVFQQDTFLFYPPCSFYSSFLCHLLLSFSVYPKHHQPVQDSPKGIRNHKCRPTIARWKLEKEITDSQIQIPKKRRT